jgi:hypothetical protein
MTFSLRTFLIVIAILACWLGAMVSQLPLFVELVANATALLILLTLALAIWEPRTEWRAFWTGFFVLAFGNMLLTQYFNAYQQTGHEVANLILGVPQPSAPQTSGFNPPTYLPPQPVPPSNLLAPPADARPSLEVEERFYQPPYNSGWSSYPATGSYTFTPVGSEYYQRHTAIRTAVPNLISLLAGVIGGWLTMWMRTRNESTVRQKEKAGTPVSDSP